MSTLAIKLIGTSTSRQLHQSGLQQRIPFIFCLIPRSTMDRRLQSLLIKMKLLLLIMIKRQQRRSRRWWVVRPVFQHNRQEGLYCTAVSIRFHAFNCQSRFCVCVLNEPQYGAVLHCNRFLCAQPVLMCYGKALDC